MREVDVVETGEDQARAQLYTIEMNLNRLRSQSYSYLDSRRRRDRNRGSLSQLTEGRHADEGVPKIIVLYGQTDRVLQQAWVDACSAIGKPRRAVGGIQIPGSRRASPSTISKPWF